MLQHRSRFLLNLLAAAVLVLGAAGGALSQSGDDVNAKQKELERIRKEIEAHRAQSKKLQSKEKQTLSSLSSLDKEIDLSRKYVRRLDEQQGALEERAGDLRVQIGGSEIVLSQQEEALAARLRQMYKHDPKYRWEIVLGAASIDEALTRYQFMKLIAAQDARLVGEFRDSKRRLEEESAKLAESLQQVAEVKAAREEESKNLESSKKKRQVVLAQIRNEKAQHTSAIKELEKAEAEVQSLIDEIVRRRVNDKDLPPSGEFAAMKGRLPWPVNGKVIRGFGKHTHPKYGTVTMNNGLDIQAPGGTPIIAVASGVVEFVDWIDAFGKCVILNHGGGYYTLYAHVATTMVSQGQKITRGQAIAEVGDTGSLEGYVCHFEVRQARKALDPAQWLGRKPSS
ncbi:MAG TPA: peptidoglycan DD-metalloendopeptidase family protein [Candidatus Krumholzibacteria bacterium]|nr:peptidoglycan DD-metalloendopeptidase family protein [Candidatus Krumholzibacteria bacterium]